jgi:hypothetical protein
MGQIHGSYHYKGFYGMQLLKIFLVKIVRINRTYTGNCAGDMIARTKPESECSLFVIEKPMGFPGFLLKHSLSISAMIGMIKISD